MENLWWQFTYRWYVMNEYFSDFKITLLTPKNKSIITYFSVFTGCDLSQYYDPLILMLEIKSQDVFIDRGEEANWMKRTTC